MPAAAASVLSRAIARRLAAAAARPRGHAPQQTTSSAAVGSFRHGTRRLLHVGTRSQPNRATFLNALGRGRVALRPGLYTRATGVMEAPQRGLSAGGVAAARSVVFAAVRRFLVYPAVAVSAAGAAVVEMKKKIPDIEDFGVSQYVHSFWDTVGNVKAMVQKEIHDLTSQVQPPPKPRVAAPGTAAQGEDDESEETRSTQAEEQGEAGAEDIDVDALDEALLQVAQLVARVAHLEQQLEETEERRHVELLQERSRLQAEIDKLIEENKDLRRTMLLDDMKNTRERPRRPIDIFSDILDLRAKIDPQFAAQDRLPRVVVVGDQSAGKTSVLEVIVRARIFPRGLGEMMTRSPIQVTLSEGDEHVAQIKGGDRLYRLDSETDLARLRTDIEKGMLRNLKDGQVVSSEPLSLVVRGPGLHPLVLVDLPGMIQHHTVGMPTTTKGSILSMCKNYIGNPNAIILCIQDASRDPEGSNVADLVREADPQGDRTIFVLTKVDLAEQLKLPSQKLKAILKGQKFNMKARSYFAVVTGTSTADDSIDTIRKAEKDFFQSSAFFRQGVFSTRKTGTDNLSRAVSELFWDRVRETVAYEARDIGMALKKKETEWRNSYPNQHRQSRDDLYAMGRHLILESVANFNESMTAAQWESKLINEIWDTIAPTVFGFYLDAADSDDSASFKTNVENMLDTWVANELPQLSVNVAQNTLVTEFLSAMDFDDATGLFGPLKEALKHHCSTNLVWDPRSVSKVKSVQELMLRDDVIKSPHDWEKATRFMILHLKDEHARTVASINGMVGPSLYWRWLSWQSTTTEQRMSSATLNELSSYFTSSQAVTKPDMSFDELKAVQHNLKIKHGLEVEHAAIQDAYSKLYKLQFYDRAIKSAQYCQSRFGYKEHENKAVNGLQCSDVLLFWRIHNMMTASGNLLRLEAMEYKRDLEEEAREMLDNLATDMDAKQKLIQGHRVSLAEEIEVLRHIQAKLDAFIKMLRKDGQSTRLTGGSATSWP
eukprot:m.12712 g.12712  ORF g.12712 m.12712 type:complete len:998 (-) comp4343_c0_seq1:112-3105(-)